MKYNMFPVLLATTFLSTNAIAQTVPEINADYLNSLTGEKVTWQDASASGEDTVQIGDKYYKYTYSKPNNLATVDNLSQSYEYTDVSTNVYHYSDIINIPADNNESILNNLFESNNINFRVTQTKYGGYLYVYGGLVYNEGTIKNIISDFVNNSVKVKKNSGTWNWVYGGVISNGGNIENIKADFIGNTINSYAAKGVVIANIAKNNDVFINNIDGNFINNGATGTGEEYHGGAIHNASSYNGNYKAVINNISGNFIGNYVDCYWDTAYGGAIYNEGEIGNISANFIGNYASNYDNMTDGGAIFNGGIIGDIAGNFTKNHADGNSPWGGAISNLGIFGNISSDFIGNYAYGENAAIGGAILTVGSLTFEETEINLGYISGSFTDNFVKVTKEGGLAFGGAIALYMGGDLKFLADNQTNIFSGNYVEDADGNRTNNAIEVLFFNDVGLPTPNLNFEIKNNGTFLFDDEIDGLAADDNTGEMTNNTGAYNINIYGDAYNTSTMDETNTIRFNDLVNNVYDFSLDSVQMALGKNAVINIVHNYVAQNNPYLRLDLDAVNREVGQINIEGDVDGTTNVIVNVLQNKETAKEESIVFATAKNDTLGGEVSFTVSRVIGSPYMWKVNYDTTEKQWGLYSTEEQNPDYEEDNPDRPDTPVQPLGPIEVAPEVIGFESLTSSGLAQTNGMVYNIMRKVGISKLYCKGCGFYDYNWDGEAFHNAWVDTTYNGLTIEAPVEIDANVWGIEAGSDLQHDFNNKLGIFASYRQGNYEMDGKGEKYYSNIGSEIDIDSYLAGLYYRYDYNDWYAFATVYGGMQNAEIKTDDGISADTDGLELGGSIEGGYSYAISRTLSVTPSLGVFYSQISYDDATDNVGKTVEYNDLKQVELEAGLKLSKAVYTDNGAASIYVKPSVVQTLVDGDEVT
ncbi:MAG: autotransporter domain-containing protein, partial [Alphaproteobacteria bacterium]|nr:autotransporter domain-containing protein [Alphaproteobacteria bacterium]